MKRENTHTSRYIWFTVLVCFFIKSCILYSKYVMHSFISLL